MKFQRNVDTNITNLLNFKDVSNYFLDLITLYLEQNKQNKGICYLAKSEWLEFDILIILKYLLDRSINMKKIKKCQFEIVIFLLSAFLNIKNFKSLTTC